MEVYILLLIIIVAHDVKTIIAQPTTESEIGNCPTYSVTHTYGPKGVSTINSPPVGLGLQDYSGPPGKAGPAGQKGEPGEACKISDCLEQRDDQRQQSQTLNIPAARNYYTKNSTGCQCYFNTTRNDCACCYQGNCACPIKYAHECVPCNKGELCGISELPRSCEFIDTKKSGVYLISPNPDLIQPFYVTCMFLNNEATTLVGHDSTMEMAADNCEPVRCYTHNVHYSISMDQIKALIEVSSNCRQYIKYRCISSVLFQGKDFFSTWVSRDGNEQRYWGGAISERDYYCACGETGSCVDSTKLCNCDINRGGETTDEGYIIDKAKLPITAVKFGDLSGSDEFGWHTIGKLECFGRA